MDALKSLQLEIHAKNELNRLAILIIKNLLPQLPQYLGKKITIADGFSKKFIVELFEPFVNNFEGGCAQIVGNRLDYQYDRLEIIIKLCFNGGSYEARPSTAYTKYIEKTFTIGDLENNEVLNSIFTLDKIIDTHKLTNVFDVETELAAINKYKELTQQLNDARRKIQVDAEYYKYL